MHRFKGWILIASLTVLAVCGLYFIPRYLYPLRYEQLLVDTATQYDLDPALVAAVIYCESHFDQDAVSDKGAQGLMQVMPETAQWLCEMQGREPLEDGALLEPEENLNLGCAMLKRMIDRYTSLTEALAAYNAGPGRVDGWLADERYSQDGETLMQIPFTQTKNYVGKVQKAYEIYKKIYRSLQS